MLKELAELRVVEYQSQEHSFVNVHGGKFVALAFVYHLG
jgi:hypothetical protein